MDRSEQQIKIASDHKILLIGQTGAGKTTIVNMMVNIQGGVKYEGERKIAIPQNIIFGLQYWSVQGTTVRGTS